MNIRVRPGADGSAPGIKVQLASGVQQYYAFADVVPHVHSEQEEEERVAEREYDWDEVRRKRTFCAILILKTIILPRQARDKHRKTQKSECRFLAGRPEWQSEHCHRTVSAQHVARSYRWMDK